MPPPSRKSSLRSNLNAPSRKLAEPASARLGPAEVRATTARLGAACLASKRPGKDDVDLAFAVLAAPADGRKESWRRLIEIALCLLLRAPHQAPVAAELSRYFDDERDDRAPEDRSWKRLRLWVYLSEMPGLRLEHLRPVMDWLDRQSAKALYHFGYTDSSRGPLTAHCRAIPASELRKRCRAARNPSVRWIYERAIALRAGEKPAFARLFDGVGEYRKLVRGQMKNTAQAWLR
jgi:hypothetical protein